MSSRRDKLQGENFEREKIRGRDRQRLLDDNTAKRLEVRRVKAQLEAERGERSRLNSLALVQQTQETWRLRDEARATKQLGQKALRDEAGIKAGGQYTDLSSIHTPSRNRQSRKSVIQPLTPEDQPP